jgi:hypothetical protein
MAPGQREIDLISCTGLHGLKGTGIEFKLHKLHNRFFVELGVSGPKLHKLHPPYIRGGVWTVK